MAIWRDPKTWGPPGLGCKWCTAGVPASHGLCVSCWVSCFGWAWAAIERWIGHQDKVYARQEERREALRLWERNPVEPDPSGIIKYAERYGVWLVSEAEIDWVLARVRR